MEQQDRDLLIRIDERLSNLQDSHKEHVHESKKFREDVNKTLHEQNNQLIALKEKQKPLIFRMLSYLFMAKGA